MDHKCDINIDVYKKHFWWEEELMSKEVIDKMSETYRKARESDDLNLFIWMSCVFEHFGFYIDWKIVSIFKWEHNTIIDIDTRHQILSIPKEQIRPYITREYFITNQ